MNIESKWLHDFIALAESLSFSQAAKQRFISQSAFSRRIQMLEQNVNCCLVERNHHQIRLTSQGRLFYQYAQKNLAELQRITDKIQRRTQ